MIRINFNNPFTEGKATPEEKARILELNNKVREVEEEKNQKEQEMSQGLTSLSGEEKLERMRSKNQDARVKKQDLTLNTFANFA